MENKEIGCFEFIAKFLKFSGLEVCFGVVGVPITQLACAMQSEGIKFYSFRNEQAASYAARLALLCTFH